MSWVLYKCGGNNSAYGIDRADHPMLPDWERREKGFQIISHFDTRQEAREYAESCGYDVQFGEGAG
jgi:hypothetical protein